MDLVHLYVLLSPPLCVFVCTFVSSYVLNSHPSVYSLCASVPFGLCFCSLLQWTSGGKAPLLRFSKAKLLVSEASKPSAIRGRRAMQLKLVIILIQITVVHCICFLVFVVLCFTNRECIKAEIILLLREGFPLIKMPTMVSNTDMFNVFNHDMLVFV